MGMFKNMRDLNQMARDIERNSPPVGERMAQAQARMANAQNMMAAQTQAANMAANSAAMLANGTAVRRDVTISGMRQVGQVNFDLLIEFEVTVMADGLPPYPATVSQTVSQMQVGRLQQGSSLQAIVETANPTSMWLDLTTLR
jgi:hypothetical protein